MGIGHFVWGGFTPVFLMGGTPFCKGFGFSFTQAKNGVPNPVGLKGHIEAYCPPFYPSMDAAVDAVVANKYGAKGCLTRNADGLTPLKDFNCISDNVVPYDERSIELTKEYCNYVFEKYGRFPATLDAIQITACLTLHHIDLDFYEKYYPPEVITDAYRNHMQVWHDGGRRCADGRGHRQGANPRGRVARRGGAVAPLGPQAPLASVLAGATPSWEWGGRGAAPRARRRDFRASCSENRDSG
jgi:hypothetical protein